MHYDKVHGYDIVKLSDLTTKQLVIHEDYVETFIETACKIGPYLFIKETLDYIEKEIDLMIKNNISPLYLDEIGELELYDQCFDHIFKRIIESNTDCYITVQKELVEKVIKKYNIKEVNIITM
jgi:nucleoside-triphosphatase THEP1